MFYLIYSSKAVPGLKESDLKNILASAQRRNSENDITGLLIFHEGTFIQMLEGNEQTVMDTFERIEEDDRHTAVLRLFSGNEENRHFPDWKMALKVVDESEFEAIGAFTSLEEGNRLLHQVKEDHIGLKMLRYFYQLKE
ncbi:MAG: blue light sensor protein [Flavobacteriales bacterium]|nr:blue light sensor protein [Flavobacteriales bacterium]